LKEIKVTLWNEYIQERENPQVKKIYPSGLHRVIAEYLNTKTGLDVRTATLNEPEQGLPDNVLNNTDVLIWWGHVAHDKVNDALVDRIYRRVLDGMGLIVLHSGHFSKIFIKLMGTSCSMSRWREGDENERIWVVNPGHMITNGLPLYFDIPESETFSEFFNIPQPDVLVFISWFKGGEVFRSGCCFYRGKGKIFYFGPGHETIPVYHNKYVLKVIYNAVWWANPSEGPKILIDGGPPSESLEK